MNTLIQNTISLYGEAGRAWLDKLPVLVAELTQTWGLRDLAQFENLSYNYVLGGFKDDRPIVLKLGFDLDNEANAIEAFSGCGVAELLDRVDGALLIERAVPGHSLKCTFPNDELKGIDIFCEVMSKLHKAPNRDFPHIKDWLSVLDDPLKDHLLATSNKEILLHGDLHHDNILAHKDGWLVIDPKGVIGEPEYEVAAFIRNPIPQLLEMPNTNKIITNRINLISYKCGFDQVRIKQWCLVQAKLARIWALEDGLDPTYFEKLVHLFK